MIERVVTEACHAGILENWGDVTKADMEATPDLLMKYESYGFRALDADGEPSIAKKVVMKLQ